MKNMALVSAMALTLFATQSLLAQQTAGRSWSGNVIVPNTWRQSVSDRQAIQVEKVSAIVTVNNLVATTQLDIFLNNPTARDEMSEILIPVPEGAVVRKFAFSGETKGATAELLTHGEAKSTFQSVVSKLKDPALLEMAGMNLVRSSVFPVPANGKQQVRIIYEHLLTRSGSRIDYVLPRSGNVSYDTPWTIDIRIESNKRISSLYSPTHPVTSSPSGRKEMSASVSESGQRNPGQFQVSWLLEDGPVTGSLFAFADRESEESGYFLLLAGMAGENEVEADQHGTIRDLTLVIDRSGSMGGGKIDQAKNAALQVLEGLNDGERFNVVIYNDQVEKFAEQSVVKNTDSMKSVRRFVTGIKATGGPSKGVDPRVAELAQEILRLSMQFGILNEYTAFLATEGTDLSNVRANHTELNGNLVSRAMECRTGWGSYNQEVNKQYSRDATCLNVGNGFYCPDMSRASIATVQQCTDNAYFRRGNRWIDN